jgi:hypothetical protein
MPADNKTHANVGTFEADIHDFKYPKFEGVVTYFGRDPDNNVALYAQHDLNENEYIRFLVTFSSEIQVRRYELPNSAIPGPPMFQHTWVDPHGDAHSTNYETAKNSGHLTVEKVDKQTGEFKATFNVGILDEDRRHQAIGKINVTGWTK